MNREIECRAAPKPEPKRQFCLGFGGVAAGVMFTVGVVAFGGEAWAGETFNNASFNGLVNACREGSTVGTNFNKRCGNIGLTSEGTGTATGSTSGSSGVGSPIAPSAVEQRLRKLREKGGGQKAAVGASADGSVDLGQGFNVFFAPGYERINKSNNKFEDGYKSDVARLTVGGDYLFSKYVVGGIAASYSYDDGVYDDGQGFGNDTGSVMVYASILPFEQAFIDITAGYTFYSLNEKRVARLFSAEGVQTFGGKISGDHDGHGVAGGILFGYDVPIKNFTVGPRAALNARHVSYDSYKEKGNTGLELRYNGESETSLQSSLGAAASIAVSTSFGVLLPQLEAAWLHEFADEQRSIKAQYRDANPGSPSFKYDTERPDRNFGIIGVGLTAVLPNGLQPFAAFRTIVGNDNYNSYAVTAGLRLEL